MSNWGSDLEDATRIRRSVLIAFERAELATDAAERQHLGRIRDLCQQPDVLERIVGHLVVQPLTERERACARQRSAAYP